MRIELDGDNKILQSFINTLTAESLESMVKSLLNGKGRVLNDIGFLFYSDLDDSERVELEMRETEILVFNNSLGEQKLELDVLIQSLCIFLTELVTIQDESDKLQINSILTKLKNSL